MIDRRAQKKGDWGASVRLPKVFYECASCGAPALIVDEAATPCHTWEAFSLQGEVHVSEAMEILTVVTVTCAAGHRFHGPIEMLHESAEEEVAHWAN